MSGIPDCCAYAVDTGCPTHRPHLASSSTTTYQPLNGFNDLNYSNAYLSDQDSHNWTSSTSAQPSAPGTRHLQCFPSLTVSDLPPIVPPPISIEGSHQLNAVNPLSTATVANTTSNRRQKRKQPGTDNTDAGTNPKPPKKRKATTRNPVPADSTLRTAPDVGRLPPAQGDPSGTGFEKVLAGKKGRPATAASDVWYFMRPLQSKEKPTEPLPPFQGPFLCEKPSGETCAAIGCRLCPWDRWKAWKNTDGQVPGLRTHLESHPDWARQVVENKLSGWKELGEKLLHRDDPPREPFTQEGFLRRLTTFMVVDDQAMNLVECPEFRELLLFISPHLREKSIPHRTKSMAMVVSGFRQCYSEVIESLRHSEGKVSFTSDIWEDADRRAFMSVTAHFIVRRDNQLVLETHLIALRHIIGRHTGAVLALYLRTILQEAGVLHKIGHFTLDNASNCDTTIRMLKEELLEKDEIMDADGEDKRVRCFAHVINLAVQDALKALHDVDRLQSVPLSTTTPSAASTFDGQPSGRKPRPSPHEYLAALKSDILKRTRELVSACRSSGQRRQNVKTAIEQGAGTGLWGEDIKPLQLMSDMEVRWSSTYYMIQRLLYLYPALRHWLQQPEQTEIRLKHEFNDTEIYVLEDIARLLRQFHNVQEALSMEHTPTLCYVIRAYEGLVIHLKNRMRSKSGIGLVHAYDTAVKKVEQYLAKCSENPIYSMAIVVNPFTKLAWIRDNWSPERYAKVRAQVISEMIQKQCNRELTATTNEHPRSHSPTAPDLFPASSSDGGYDDDNSAWVAMFGNGVLQSRAASVPVPSVDTSEEARYHRNLEIVELELRSYEAENLASDVSVKNGGILRYWQNRESEFPNLFKIAMDVLPVQATSVPSERIFSSAGRTVTKDRNRLAPQHFEMLQIYKFYLRSKRLSFVSDWLDDEQDILMANLQSDMDIALATGEHQQLLELLAELEE